MSVCLSLLTLIPSLFSPLQQNQLDFLLSKASEYSNFIAQDLEQLQANMADEARRAVTKAEKRAASSSSSSNKKRKAEKVEKAHKKLKSAQDKDAVVRAGGGGKHIFVQPPNLSKDCQLKDYQLEGVRWLASLFENGVSGILADEMGLYVCLCVCDRCRCTPMQQILTTHYTFLLSFFSF